VVPTLGEGAPFLQADTLTGSLSTASTHATPSQPPTYVASAPRGGWVRLLATRADTQDLVPVGRTHASADGTWQLTTRPLAAGHYRVVAVASAPVSPVPRRLYFRPTTWLGPLTVD